MFNSSVLLPYNSTDDDSIRVASSVIGATLMNYTITNLSDPISITLRLEDPVSLLY